MDISQKDLEEKLRQIVLSACPEVSESPWMLDQADLLTAAKDSSERDLDHEMLLEDVRRTCELSYKKNPSDADNLTRWAKALIDLSYFEDEIFSEMKMVEDAIKKLKEALIVNPRNYEAIWSLGITYGRFGILIPELDMAKGYFAEAAQYFQQAVDGDPSNDCYARSLRLIATFPKVHEEIYKYAECFFGRPLRGHGSSTYSNAKVSEKKRASDLKCDIVGWVILAVGIFVWLGTSKSHERPPPPR